MTKEDSQPGEVHVNWRSTDKKPPLWHRLWARLLIKKGAAADQAPPGNTITSGAEESNPDESGRH